mgnify:CR=1 FL=1
MIYKVQGKRTDGKLRLFLNGNEVTPSHSQKVWNHSPTGFNAGYGGSGPAQSALAILLRITDKDTAIREHQPFKWEFLAEPAYLHADFEFEFDFEEWIKAHA